ESQPWPSNATSAQDLHPMKTEQAPGKLSQWERPRQKRPKIADLSVIARERNGCRAAWLAPSFCMIETILQEFTLHPLLALTGHALVHRKCPLSGVKRTWAGAVQMSAYDRYC